MLNSILTRVQLNNLSGLNTIISDNKSNLVFKVLLSFLFILQILDFNNSIFLNNQIILISTSILLNKVLLVLFLLVLNLVFLYFNNYTNQNNISFLYSLYFKYNFLALYAYVSYIYNWYLNILVFALKNLNISSYVKLPIFWYPIFKRSSIFGFYRISRQRWSELKTEEVNYLKY